MGVPEAIDGLSDFVAAEETKPPKPEKKQKRQKGKPQVEEMIDAPVSDIDQFEHIQFSEDFDENQEAFQLVKKDKKKKKVSKEKKTSESETNLEYESLPPKDPETSIEPTEVKSDESLPIDLSAPE